LEANVERLQLYVDEESKEGIGMGPQVDCCVERHADDAEQGADEKSPPILPAKLNCPRSELSKFSGHDQVRCAALKRPGH